MGNKQHKDEDDWEPPDDSYIRSPRGTWLGTREWLPSSTAIGLVILVHGLFDHSGRDCYKEVVQALNDAGFIVCACDHQGHGLSKGARAKIHKYKYYIDDLEEFTSLVMKKHTVAKPFLLGHSMGGGISIMAALRNQDLYQGLVVNGPAIWVHKDENYSSIERSACELVSHVVPGLTVDYEDPSKLTRNVEARQSYVDDPLVTTSVGASSGLITQLIEMSRDAESQWKDLKLPILIFHGTADKTCSIEGSETLHKEIPSTDKTLKKLEGVFHEPWEDEEVKDEVVKTIVDWIVQRNQQQ